MFLFYFQTGYMIYLGETTPLSSLTDQRMDFFNEFAVMASIYTLPLFTDYVPEHETQYSIGWASISIAYIHIFVNWGVITYTSGKQMLQKCKQKYCKTPDKVKISVAPQLNNQTEVQAVNEGGP